MLTCVAAIAKRSQECNRPVDEFLDVLNGRINSMANTHTLLSRIRWEGVGLGELVRSELAFCAKDESALIEGPEVGLAAMALTPRRWFYMSSPPMPPSTGLCPMTTAGLWYAGDGRRAVPRVANSCSNGERLAARG